MIPDFLMRSSVFQRVLQSWKAVATETRDGNARFPLFSNTYLRRYAEFRSLDVALRRTHPLL